MVLNIFCGDRHHSPPSPPQISRSQDLKDLQWAGLGTIMIVSKIVEKSRLKPHHSKPQSQRILQDFGRKTGHFKPERVEGWRFSEEKTALRPAQCSRACLTENGNDERKSRLHLSQQATQARSGRNAVFPIVPSTSNSCDRV